MREEFNAKKLNFKPELKPKISPTKKPEHHPVKGIISNFEKEKEKEKDNKQIEEEKNTINAVHADKDVDSQEKVNCPSIIPPKPLPRTSRTSSMCDSQSVDDGNNAPKPVARPRTNSLAPIVTSVSPVAPATGGYKVNLIEFWCEKFFRFLLFFFVAITIFVL